MNKRRRCILGIKIIIILLIINILIYTKIEAVAFSDAVLESQFGTSITIARIYTMEATEMVPFTVIRKYEDGSVEMMGTYRITGLVIDDRALNVTIDPEFNSEYDNLIFQDFYFKLADSKNEEEYDIESIDNGCTKAEEDDDGQDQFFSCSSLNNRGDMMELKAVIFVPATRNISNEVIEDQINALDVQERFILQSSFAYQ